MVQDGGVGLLKLPLLAGGGGVTGVHEEPPLAQVAVDAAVADGVIQTFVLQEERAATYSHQGTHLFYHNKTTQSSENYCLFNKN